MIKIVHDFTPRLDEVRESALQSGFGTWKPNKGEVGSSVYDGMNFWGKHAVMLHALEFHINGTVYPNNMFFRVTNKETEKAYVHSDRESGTHTCVVYLSDHKEVLSGTGFYRHRETGMVEMPAFSELQKTPDLFEKLKHEMVDGGDKYWELTDFVKGSYNKAVIFDAPLFHARTPKNGVGETAEEGRMVWVCHFLLKPKT